MKSAFFNRVSDYDSCLWYNQIMTELNTTILQKASGENRLHPDEQRRYMNTFRERVVLVVEFSEATADGFRHNFASLCSDLQNQVQPLFVKLSPRLSDSLQISLLKEAQQAGLTASIVSEGDGASPYALVFHSDHALDKQDISLSSQVPQNTTSTEKSPEKLSFWSRLFGK